MVNDSDHPPFAARSPISVRSSVQQHNWIVLTTASPDCQIVMFDCQSFRQPLHRESLAPVVAQQPHPDAQRLGFQTSMKGRFAGNHRIATGTFGGRQKTSPATTCERDLSDPLIRITDQTRRLSRRPPRLPGGPKHSTPLALAIGHSDRNHRSFLHRRSLTA